MPEINLVDTNLKKNAEEKEISVQISQNGLSFCINTMKDKKVMAFRSCKFENAILLEDILNQTRAIFEKEPLLNMTFSKTRFLYINRKSTLVPDEFFEPDLCKRYIEFNQPIDDLDELHYNSIYRIKSKLIFALPTYLATFITEKFKNVEFYNQAMPLIDILGGLSGRTEGNQVLVNLNKDFFDMVVYNNGKLKLSNSFLYSSSNDLVYFILFVCKQLTINYSDSVFYITGECSDKMDLVNELSTYLNNIRKPELFSDLSRTIKIREEHFIQYATLFKLI